MLPLVYPLSERLLTHSCREARHARSAITYWGHLSPIAAAAAAAEVLDEDLSSSYYYCHRSNRLKCRRTSTATTTTLHLATCTATSTCTLHQQTFLPRNANRAHRHESRYAVPCRQYLERLTPYLQHSSSRQQQRCVSERERVKGALCRVHTDRHRWGGRWRGAPTSFSSLRLSLTSTVAPPLPPPPPPGCLPFPLPPFSLAYATAATWPSPPPLSTAFITFFKHCLTSEWSCRDAFAASFAARASAERATPNSRDARSRTEILSCS